LITANGTWRAFLLVFLFAGNGCMSRPGIDTPVFGAPCLLGLSEQRQYLFGENAPGTESRLKKLDAMGGNDSGPHVLAMSGGGPNGTYGAGYLVGWKNTRPFPDFDYVTGVSAGALLATHAFIGGEDVTRLELLGSLVESDIIRLKLLPFSLFSDSIYSTAPLRKQVIEALLAPADPTLQKVAAKSASGGVLRIGAVDLENGEFVQIDLGVIAEAYVSPDCAAYKREIYDLYVDSIRASAAVPLMMPPVPIAGRLLADGGVRKQLFLDQPRRGSPGAATGPASAVAPGSTPTTWVIVNGAIALDFGLFGVQEGAAKANLGSIAPRSVFSMIDSSLDNDLYRVCASGAVNVVSMDPLYELYPEAWPACRGRNKGTFDGDYMGCLFELGYALGQQGETASCPPG